MTEKYICLKTMIMTNIVTFGNTIFGLTYILVVSILNINFKIFQKFMYMSKKSISIVAQTYKDLHFLILIHKELET